MGKEVITSDAIIIGTVDGVGVDTDNWKVPAIRVNVRKGNEAALGMKQKFLGTQKVFVATPQVSSVSDNVTLAVKMDQVREVLVDEKKVQTTATTLLKKKVVGQDGKEIGYMDNVHFDATRGWEVSKLDIKLGKTTKQALEAKKGVAPSSQVSIQTKDVKTVGDMVMLRLDMDGLKDYLDSRQVLKK